MVFNKLATNSSFRECLNLSSDRTELIVRNDALVDSLNLLDLSVSIRLSVSYNLCIRKRKERRIKKFTLFLEHEFRTKLKSYYRVMRNYICKNWLYELYIKYIVRASKIRGKEKERKEEEIKDDKKNKLKVYFINCTADCLRLKRAWSVKWKTHEKSIRGKHEWRDTSPPFFFFYDIFLGIKYSPAKRFCIMHPVQAIVIVFPLINN